MKKQTSSKKSNSTSYSIINRKARSQKLIKIFGIISVVLLIGLAFLIMALASKEEEKINHLVEIEKKEEEDLALYLTLTEQEASENFLKEFLACQTVEEAKPYVLPDKNINKTLEKYWKPRSFEKIDFSVDFSRVLFNEIGTVHAFKGINDGNENDFLYLLRVVEIINRKEIAPLAYIEDQAAKVILHRRKIKLLEEHREELYEQEVAENNVKVYPLK